MAFKYQKLVRDNKVKQIEKDPGLGGRVVWHTLDDEEYRFELLRKVLEGALNLKDSMSLESRADMQEALDALDKVMNFSKDEIDVAQKNMRKADGGYQDKVYLEKVLVTH